MQQTKEDYAKQAFQWAKGMLHTLAQCIYVSFVVLVVMGVCTILLDFIILLNFLPCHYIRIYFYIRGLIYTQR
jgi:hypothetical protein